VAGNRRRWAEPAQGFPVRGAVDARRSAQRHGSFHLPGLRGDIWLGTGNGIAKIPPVGKLVHYTTKNGFSSDLVWPVLRDRDGDLWAGSEDGCCTGFAGRPERPGGPPHLAAFSRRPDDLPAERRHGVGGHHQRAEAFQPRTHECIGEGRRLPPPPVSFRRSWNAPTAAYGWERHRAFRKFQGGRFRPPITKAQGLAGTNVVDLYEDRSAPLWLVDGRHQPDIGRQDHGVHQGQRPAGNGCIPDSRGQPP